MRAKLILFYLVLIFSHTVARYIDENDESFHIPDEPIDTNRFIVKYKNAAGKAAVNAAAGKVHLELPNSLLAVTIPEQAMNALKKNPNIQSIEVDPPRQPMDLIRGTSTHSHSINATSNQRQLTEVMPYGIKMVQADQVSLQMSSNVTVCVIDSGYDTNHEDLGTATGYQGNLPWDRDGCGHGTHVAGTISALDNDFGVVGVAPGVKIHVVRVFRDTCGWAYASDLIDALDQCQKAQAKIVSMSLGCSGIGCGSLAEQQAFGAAYSKGVLSVAAAGNFGNAVLSYPASYDSVISVAAVDQNEEIAYFSQYNSQVELAAPGVAVNSTVPCYIEGTKTNGVIKVTASPIINAARGIGSGSLVNCGLGDGKTKCSPSGKICLVKNGKVSLYQKVLFCENKGAVATIVYNDVNGILTGTLAPNSSRYPVVGISNVDGATLVASWLGQTVKVVVVERSTKYTSWSGTSMATPHVSGVAALLWSNYPSVSNAEIRNALRVTAKDKGDVGRDDMYGYGIIQAQAAMSFLGSCAKLNDSCESSSNCCSGNCADAVCSS